MMTVAQAIEALSKLDRTAVLVVGGHAVEGIEGPVAGRLRKGYAGHAFTIVEKGREKAVFFTRQVENSDGVFRPTRL